MSSYPSAFCDRFQPLRRRARAFTLVETLVVIGVVGLLISLAVPALQRVRESAAKVQCQSQVRQIALALHLYHTDHGHLPPKRRSTQSADRDPEFLLSWHVRMLPYLEQGNRYREAVEDCQHGDPWLHPPHRGLARQFKLYACPTDDRLNAALVDEDGALAVYGSYIGVAGANHNLQRRQGMFEGPMSGPGASFSECFDGLSNTLMVGERPPPDTLQAGQWYSGLWHMKGKYHQLRGPDGSLLVRMYAYGADDQCGSGPEGFLFGPGRTDNPCDRYHFWSLHPGGANFAFGDCSVRFLRYSMSQQLLADLATRAGGEAILDLD